MNDFVVMSNHGDWTEYEVGVAGTFRCRHQAGFNITKAFFETFLVLKLKLPIDQIKYSEINEIHDIPVEFRCAGVPTIKAEYENYIYIAYEV